MMIKKIQLLVFMLAAVAFGCQNSQNSSFQETLPTGNHKAIVKEIIHTTQYTYLRLDENGQELWVAVNRQDFNEGATVYYLEGLEMNNFESSELQRTFPTVYFVQEISDQPIQPPAPMIMGSTEPKKPVLSKIDVTVDLPEGGISIADLYANKAEYNGKNVTVRGKVTKVNNGIMGRNWIHIQDGTGDDTHFDLTITSDDAPNEGDIVTYWGTVGLDKDFGMGYTYELILEQAERLK